MAGKDDNHNFYLGTTFIFFFVVAAVLWYFFSGAITSMVRWLRVGEMNILSIVTDKFDTARHVLPQMLISPHAEKLSQNHLDWPTLWNLSAAVGDYMRWPTAIGLFIFYMVVSKTTPNLRFKNKYKLESLIGIQSKTWPVISPIVNFNPGKVS